MPAAEHRAVSLDDSQRLLGIFSDLPVLILAISGGPDSTALLWLAARWRKSLKRGPKLVAVTIDHGLRPESKREAQAVAELARKLGVEHRTLRWTGRKPKTGIQEIARETRYRLLAAAARKAGAPVVITAHTLDDQAETVLFRLLRGTGVGGLAGMALAAPMPFADMSRTVLARPLLRVPKSRLIATLKAAKLTYIDDPSNRDLRFARPRLRDLMPVLAREGLSSASLARLAGRASRVETAMDGVVQAAAHALSAGEWRAGQRLSIPAGRLFQLPEEVVLRLVGRAIDCVGNEGPVELGKLEALVDVLYSARPTGRFRRTLAGAVVTLASDELTVERAPLRRGSALERP